MSYLLSIPENGCAQSEMRQLYPSIFPILGFMGFEYKCMKYVVQAFLEQMHTWNYLRDETSFVFLPSIMRLDSIVCENFLNEILNYLNSIKWSQPDSSAKFGCFDLFTSTLAEIYPDFVVKTRFKNPRPQHFAVSFPIIKYMIQSRNGKPWMKLIQTCKYFFYKKDLYPVANFVDETADIFGKVLIFRCDGEVYDHLKGFAKLWLHESIYSKKSDYNKSLSCIIPKINIFDVQRLDLQYKELSFEEYQILTCSGTIKYLSFFAVKIKYSNGEKVTADKLFETLPVVETIDLHKGFYKPDTVKKMAEMLPRFLKLKKLKLYGLNGFFNFNDFTDFLLKKKDVSIELKYTGEPADAYKRVLENFMEKVLENPVKMAPRIWFRGMKEETLEDYEKMLMKQGFRF